MSFPRSRPSSKRPVHSAHRLVNDFCLCIFIFIIIPFFFDQHCPLVFRFPFVIKLTLSVTFYYFFAPKVFPVTVGGRGTTLKVFFFFLLLWAGAKVAL